MAGQARDLCKSIDAGFSGRKHARVLPRALAAYVVDSYKKYAAVIGGYYHPAHLLCDPVGYLIRVQLDEADMASCIRALVAAGARDPRTDFSKYQHIVLYTQNTALLAYLVTGVPNARQRLDATYNTDFLSLAIQKQLPVLVAWLAKRRFYDPRASYLTVCLRVMGELGTKNGNTLQPHNHSVFTALVSNGFSWATGSDMGPYDHVVLGGLVACKNRSLLQRYIDEMRARQSVVGSPALDAQMTAMKMKEIETFWFLLVTYPPPNLAEFGVLLDLALYLADIEIFDTLFLRHANISPKSTVLDKVRNGSRQLFKDRATPVPTQFLEHLRKKGIPAADMLVLAVCGNNVQMARKLIAEESVIGPMRCIPILNAKAFVQVVQEIPPKAAIIVLREMGGLTTSLARRKAFEYLYSTPNSDKEMIALAYILAGGAFTTGDMVVYRDVVRVRAATHMFWRRGIRLHRECTKVITTFLACLKKRGLRLPTELLLMIMEFCQIKDICGIPRHK